LSSISKISDTQESERRQALIEQLQFLGEAASTETALFQQAAAAKYGLGVTDMKTLSILIQEGEMTAGEIGSRLGLTSGSVTTLIDRLAQQDLVKRQPHTKDRRKVIIMVNQEKLAAEENVYRSMGEAFVRLLGTYTTEQLEFLVKFHQASIEVTKQEIARLANSI
jgi:DNA-binding MarR family transcriptional regulator